MSCRGCEFCEELMSDGKAICRHEEVVEASGEIVNNPDDGPCEYFYWESHLPLPSIQTDCHSCVHNGGYDEDDSKVYCNYTKEPFQAPQIGHCVHKRHNNYLAPSVKTDDGKSILEAIEKRRKKPDNPFKALCVCEDLYFSGVVFEDGVTKEIYRCPKCGKETRK